MPNAHVLPFLLAATLAGCSPAAHQDPLLDTNSEIITHDEIVASRASSAYDVIKKLHGNFFSYRGRTSFIDSASAMPVVFVDDQAYGPISSLRNIPASEIDEIRLYRAWEAVLKYGSGLPGGAISIKSRLEN